MRVHGNPQHTEALHLGLLSHLTAQRTNASTKFFRHEETLNIPFLVHGVSGNHETSSINVEITSKQEPRKIKSWLAHNLFPAQSVQRAEKPHNATIQYGEKSEPIIFGFYLGLLIPGKQEGSTDEQALTCVRANPLPELIRKRLETLKNEKRWDSILKEINKDILKPIVLTYYTLIDAITHDTDPEIKAKIVEVILSLFDKNAVYMRGGDHFIGTKALKDFFLNERHMAGEHIIDTVSADTENLVLNVSGVFSGTGQNDQRMRTQFTDEWRFGPDLKVIVRRSYFLIGSVTGNSKTD